MTVEQHGYKTVKAFMTEYKATTTEYEAYTNEAKKTAQPGGEKTQMESVREKLKRKQKQANEQENGNAVKQEKKKGQER